MGETEHDQTTLAVAAKDKRPAPEVDKRPVAPSVHPGVEPLGGPAKRPEGSKDPKPSGRAGSTRAPGKPGAKSAVPGGVSKGSWDVTHKLAFILALYQVAVTGFIIVLDQHVHLKPWVTIVIIILNVVGIAASFLLTGRHGPVRRRRG